MYHNDVIKNLNNYVINYVINIVPLDDKLLLINLLIIRKYRKYDILVFRLV
jgi:hypothetical protein